MSSTQKSAATITEEVKKYYGESIKQTADLATNACAVAPGSIPKHVRAARKLIHQEVADKYYGCGLVVPEHLEKMSILDLGSGAGHDCFILSKLVGEEGKIVGLDMTDEQLEIAEKFIPYHTEVFGLEKPNVEFVKGFIENLAKAGLKDDTFDIIISNCVVNLSPDKRAVLKEAYRVLKTGGEFFFSDMYADKDLPEEIRKKEVLWGEGLAGAIYWKDLVNMCKDIGFSQPRLVTSRAIVVYKPELAKLVEGYSYVSATYRLFKLDAEDKNLSVVTYNGGIAGYEEELKFDHLHTFPKGKEMSVSVEMANILHSSRFNEFFNFKTAPLGEAKEDGVVINPFTVVENAVCRGVDAKKCEAA